MNKIKELREAKSSISNRKITQQDLAELLGVDRATISNYERGTHEPSQQSLFTLSEYFNVSVDYLLGNDINIQPVQTTDDVYHFPVRIIGEGSCGLGKNNEDYLTTETFDIPNSWIIGNFNDYFLVVAKGDSMIDEHITNNSLLLFKRQETLENGQIGAFSLNGEDYIKKFKKFNSGLISLQSANSKYDDIEVDDKDDFRVVGILKKIVISKGE
ncbi:XRE family transcriptional regulator [Erysipelotrichaceae bacterium OttesenSCG-928-M19]|nr:XRE family transcriptional regulator [Erysipelotrichaceae bacterium OttesenSCG-928-M19]